MKEVTWKSPSNIALVKYWGKYPVQIPANPSISFTLSAAATTTTLKYAPGTGQIEVYLEGVSTPSFLPKIKTFLERTVEQFPFASTLNLEIHTSNSFPHSSGIASSASGMSALALCLMSVKQALGLAGLACKFDFADKKGIVHMAMVGTNEMGAAAIPVKNLSTGEQEVMTLEQIVALLG